jgi:hypothetical protein
MKSVKFMSFKEMISVYRKSDIERVKYALFGKMRGFWVSQKVMRIIDIVLWNIKLLVYVLWLTSPFQICGLLKSCWKWSVVSYIDWKINCVNVLMSTFMPIKRITYISCANAKEQNERMRFEKTAWWVTSYLVLFTEYQQGCDVENL